MIAQSFKIVVSLVVLTTVVAVAAIAEQALGNSEPSKIVITMPDYHRQGRTELLVQTEVFERQLVKVAEESMKLALDERLQMTVRLSALNNVRLLSPEVAADTLLREIEFRDTRAFGFAGPFLGEYPVVTLLENYGPAVAPYLIAELLKTEGVSRRKLMCDALVKVLGPAHAIEKMRNSFHGSMTMKELRNLDAVVRELESRHTAPKK